MAQELATTNGKYAMAFTGDRSKIWHGLGQEIPEDATIAQWIVEAGLDWTVESSDVIYSVPNGLLPEVRVFNDRKVLYRSDDHKPLSVVSSDFKIVQPKEVVEFFSDLVEKHDMKLSTAGALFDGRRFWALAELGKEFEVINGDKVKGHLLLTTAVDGSMHTTAKFTSVRVVCNNTLTIALNTSSTNLVKVSHRRQWDPDSVKLDLGLIEQGWYDFITNTRKMANTKFENVNAWNFIKDVMYQDLEKPLTKLQERKVDEVMTLTETGMGAEYAPNSLWNVVNAITQKYTHGSGKRNESHQFWDSQFGTGEQMKTRAYNKALAIIA